MTDNYYLEALHAAYGILNQTVEPVEGCRALVGVLQRCGPEIADHPAALVLRGVESETDVFPMGQQREHWNPSELGRLDRERDEYWMQVESEVRRACSEVVRMLEEKVPEDGE